VRVRPSVRFVDSGKWSEEVYGFVRDVSRLPGDQNSGAYFATKGFGLSQDQAKVYTEQSKVSGRVRFIGDRYHLTLQEAHQVYLVHMDADTWKTRVHSALGCALDRGSPLVLWRGDWRETFSLSKHLLSEVGIEVFDPGRGMVRKWEKKHSNNHWFDGAYGCFVALDYAAFVGGGEKGEGGSLKGEGGRGKFEGGSLKGEGGSLKGEERRVKASADLRAVAPHRPGDEEDRESGGFGFSGVAAFVAPKFRIGIKEGE
jgi:hypothetical protein